MPLNAKQFQKTLIYQANAPEPVLQADLGVLRTLDAVAEQRERVWGVSAGIAVLASIGGLGFWAHEGYTALAGIPLGISLLVAVAAFVVMGGAARQNTENRRYNLAARVLGLLHTDLAAEEPVSIELDLRPPTERSKHERDGRVREWSVEYYRDTWLRMSGRLADGTRWRLEVTDLVQLRTRTKFSASGKRKTKTKTKRGTNMSLQLKAKTQRYQALDKLNQRAREAIRLPDFAQLKKVELRDGWAGLVASTKAVWDAAEPGHDWEGYTPGDRIVAAMFLSLYQILNLSRRVTKRLKAG